MKKSVKYAAAAALLLLLCAVGVYGTFLHHGTSAARSMIRFVEGVQLYAVTSKTIYNYAFPSEEITLSAGKSGNDRAAACGQ